LGYYIEVPDKHNKADQIVDLYGGKIVPCPTSFLSVPPGKAQRVLTASIVRAEWVNKVNKMIARISAIALPSEHRLLKFLKDEWFNLERREIK